MLIGPTDAPRGAEEPFTRWRSASLHELLSHCGLSDRAVTVLGAQAANYGLGPAQVSVVSHVAMLGEFLLGAYYPVGGGQMLAAGLVEVVTAYGGELRTRARVERIEVEHGRVTGVRLAGGELICAPIVVSNADYRRTVLELVGPEHLPAAAVSRVRRLVMALPLVTVYLAVSLEATPPPAHNLWCFETESLVDAFAELDSGDFTEPRFAFISSGSAKGGPTTPPGRTPHHTLEVMAVAPAAHRPWLVDDDTAIRYGYRHDAAYLAEKDRIGQSLVDIAERVLGPLRPHLLHYEVATPATQTRFTLASGGTPYGVASTPRQLAFYRPGHQSPLPGLYLAGVSTRSGLGISGAMIGGVRCAELILRRPLLAEVHLGKVLGNPGLLPPRPPGWDPLLASRGSRSSVHKGRKE
jgi:phytoene dehydrogenase-like protein